MRPEAKGELVVVLLLYDDSPVKDGWFSSLSQLVCRTAYGLTSRDMVDMMGGVLTVDVQTGEGRIRDRTSPKPIIRFVKRLVSTRVIHL